MTRLQVFLAGSWLLAKEKDLKQIEKFGYLPNKAELLLCQFLEVEFCDHLAVKIRSQNGVREREESQSFFTTSVFLNSCSQVLSGKIFTAE